MEANGPDPARVSGSYGRAVRTGARRAALHMVKAGYEMVAGVGAFLEELVIARSRRTETGEADPYERPTRIPLD